MFLSSDYKQDFLRIGGSIELEFKACYEACMQVFNRYLIHSKIYIFRISLQRALFSLSTLRIFQYKVLLEEFSFIELNRQLEVNNKHLFSSRSNLRSSAVFPF